MTPKFLPRFRVLCFSSVLPPHIQNVCGTSPVAQWIGAHLPMQWTRVRILVWEDPTCLRETELVHHRYRSCAPESVSRDC